MMEVRVDETDSDKDHEIWHNAERCRASFVNILGLTRDHLLANTYQATTPTNLDTPLWLSCSVGHTEM
jgi:hypothetical protein